MQKLSKNWNDPDEEEAYLQKAEKYAGFRKNIASKKEGTYFFKFMR